MHVLEYGQEQEKTLLFLPCTAEPVWAFAAAALRTGFICPHKIHMPTAAMMSKPTIMNRIAPSPS